MAHSQCACVFSRDNSVYNFPTNDLSGGFQEIEDQLENVFNSQVNAFRINLSFGLLLRNFFLLVNRFAILFHTQMRPYLILVRW